MDNQETYVMINSDLWDKVTLQPGLGTFSLEFELDDEQFAETYQRLMGEPFSNDDPIQLDREAFALTRELDDYDMDIICLLCVIMRMEHDKESRIPMDEFCDAWNNMMDRKKLGLRTFDADEVSERISKMMRYGVAITYKHGSDRLNLKYNLCPCGLIWEDGTEYINIHGMSPIFFPIKVGKPIEDGEDNA